MDHGAIGWAYFAVSGLESIRAQPRAMLSDPNDLTAGTMTRSSSPDRREERFDTDDVHHAREVVGEHVQRHLGHHFLGSVFIRKCVAPIRIFRVPNGCSTVSRRVRIASGFLSRRACTASTTYSSSHRLMRRCGPFVH